MLWLVLTLGVSYKNAEKRFGVTKGDAGKIPQIGGHVKAPQDRISTRKDFKEGFGFESADMRNALNSTKHSRKEMISCPNGLPSYVQTGEWLAFERNVLSLSGSYPYSIKDGWICIRLEQQQQGYEYHCAKDGEDLWGSEVTQECNAPATWPTGPVVSVAPNVPPEAMDCLGNPKVTKENCAVFSYEGSPDAPTSLALYCEDRGVLFKFSYSVEPPTAGVHYGEHLIKNIYYTDGYCNKSEPCAGGMPPLMTDIDWKPNYYVSRWFEDYGIKDGWFCTRYVLGDAMYKCHKNAVEVEFQGSKRTGHCFGPRTWPTPNAVGDPELGEDEEGVKSCFSNLVKGSKYVTSYSRNSDNPEYYSYYAHSLLSDLVVDFRVQNQELGSGLSAIASLELLGWARYMEHAPLNSTYEATESPKCDRWEDATEQTATFPWAEGITEWGQFITIQIGVKDGKLCQKYNGAWRCFKNGQRCVGLKPDNEIKVAYDTCPNGRTLGAETSSVWATDAQQEKLAGLVDTSKCAVVESGSSQVESYCWIEGKLTTITASYGGPAQLTIIGSNGTVIGLIELDEDGSVEQIGIMPAEPEYPESPSDKSGSKTTIIVIAVVASVVVVGAAVGIGVACYLKSKKPAEDGELSPNVEPPAANADPSPADPEPAVADPLEATP
jgi:hypothetical protein